VVAGGHPGLLGVELIFGRGDDDGVAGAAVIVVLFVVWVGKSAWKKPNAGARLAALLGLIVGVWFIFAVADPAGGGLVAEDAAKGIGAFAVALGKLLGSFKS
jgi:hypothetical protein